MRLLNIHTRRLKSFADEESAPRYGILSHTWGEEEITFTDIEQKGHAELRRKKGYRKIDFVCERAKSQESYLEYAWIDTCCIDKSSSAELSEAINSMFKWYKQSDACWVFLEDFSKFDGNAAKSRRQHFVDCRWFTRGWTLQELIAPREVMFYDRDQNLIGRRSEMVGVVEKATGVDASVLRRIMPLSEVSIAKRMSWAACRRTTRTEDRAYSLLGIFDINMPLLYGEGNKAFRRLQEEIMKVSIDQSILAWNPTHERNWGLSVAWDSPQDQDMKSRAWNAQEGEAGELLAASPSDFAECGKISSFHREGSQIPYRLTNSGLEITLPLTMHVGGNGGMLAILACGPEDDPSLTLCLFLEALQPPMTTEVPAYLLCKVGGVDRDRTFECPNSMISSKAAPQNLMITTSHGRPSELKMVFRSRGKWKISVLDPGPFDQKDQSETMDCVWASDCIRQGAPSRSRHCPAQFTLSHESGATMLLIFNFDVTTFMSRSYWPWHQLAPSTLQVVIFDRIPGPAQLHASRLRPRSPPRIK